MIRLLIFDYTYMDYIIVTFFRFCFSLWQWTTTSNWILQFSWSFWL